MNGLLAFSKRIDQLNEWVGRMVMWLVLISVLISAGNAIMRKVFDTSSNAFLEIQWYLFAAVFLLGAAYTMLHQGHVKIDVLLSRLSRKKQVIVEMFGVVVFLLPFVISVIVYMTPILREAFVSGEMSENAGGLVRWPVYALIPAGFFLLGLQGVSEFIKRLAFYLDLAPDPAITAEARSTEEELAEVIRKHQMEQEALDKAQASDSVLETSAKS